MGAGEMKERLRFAPSPTGYLHLGNVRTALFNWLHCRSKNGTFILRIEDTDPKRSREEYIHLLMDSLRWLGMDWDEGPDIGGNYGPYRQSKRLNLYEKYARILLENGCAFPCFCPPGKAPRVDYLCRSVDKSERMERMETEPFALRFLVPVGTSVKFTDLLRGELTFQAEDLGDFPLSRRLNQPLYNFSCVIDDHFMEITLVMRGEDHISNTPKQVLLYQALGWQSPEYLHLPLILGEDGTPLSKRHGVVSLEYYRQQGYLAEAMMNFLSLLGWSPGDDREMIPREELLRSFHIERIHKAPARFHFSKLRWLNSKYIHRLSDEEFVTYAKTFLKNMHYHEVNADRIFAHLPRMFRERIETFGELQDKADFLFLNEITIPEELRQKYLSEPKILSWLKKVYDLLLQVEPFERNYLEPILREGAKKEGLNPAEAFQPIRVAVSGKDATPGLFDILEVLGKPRILNRLEKTLQ